MSENLENIWKDATSHISKSVSERWWTYVVNKYNENGRNCHNIQILTEKFKNLDKFKHFIQNPNAFTLALFFQYLEYSPQDSECHVKNMETFHKFVTEAGISSDSDLWRDIKCLLEASAIHCTDEHKTEGAFGDTDLHYFLDLDMSVLGSSEQNYETYIKNIHCEYSFLDEAAYEKLRKKVLQSFLLIPNIFATKYFRDKYELQARKNIQQELNTFTRV